MSPTLLKTLMIGIPLSVGLAGIVLIVWLIREGIKSSRDAKNTVSGFLYLHPEHGGGHEERLHDKKLVKPDLRPIYYKEHWYSGETPLWFFYEDKVEATVQVAEQVLKCACGYEASGKPQLQAHTMWSPRRSIDGKVVTKEDWVKVHSKVEAPIVEFKPAAPLFVIKPYDIDAETSDPVVTPFAIFNINNWDCQSGFIGKRQSGMAQAIQLGAGVVMVVACLIGIIVIAGELNKPDVGAVQTNKPVTMVLEKIQ